ncbi:MAG: oligosaccharide flippase family protein [Clostridia bacterium]|nr:oligosaccharide flippase family protein [Clostridia bacterium]
MSDDRSIETGAVAVKAGLWYTICNFLFKGMAFLSTPIFSRLMSKEELGGFSNFSSWVSILFVVTSMDLSQSIIRSKLELEEDIDSYIWSILSMSTLWTLLLYIFVCIFMPFFSNLFETEAKYIHIMFLYLFSAPAYFMLITKNRAFYKYKSFVAMTGLMAVSGIGLSLLLVFIMQDRLGGRIIGYYLPQIIIGFVIFVLLACRGKRIKIQYWKYASILMLPLVPHVLSLYLLAASDKIIITKFCGEEYTAVYSIAYTAYHVVTVLFDSMNKAWAPWLLESLHNKNYETIRNASRKYIAVFFTLMLGVMLLVPEIILILGSSKYMRAVWCLPPLIASCVFQFIYTMYVNIEFYEKKTLGVSFATMIATAINILLNILIIPLWPPEYSYVIAAYTTLAGYIVLFILHFFLVKRLKMDFVYDIKFILMILGLTLAVSGIMNYLYGISALRYCIVAVYTIMILYFGYRNKTKMLQFIKNKKNSRLLL